MWLSLIPQQSLEELLAETEFLLECGNSMFTDADVGLQHADDVFLHVRHRRQTLP